MLCDELKTGTGTLWTGSYVFSTSVSNENRLGDTYRWKSENVATMEVAQSLGLCPGVAEAAVYGVSVPGHDGKFIHSFLKSADETRTGWMRSCSPRQQSGTNSSVLGRLAQILKRQAAKVCRSSIYQAAQNYYTHAQPKTKQDTTEEGRNQPRRHLWQRQ
jgi:acyl-CoA synthetase (AMP-forming)/AMP-acid ligase II